MKNERKKEESAPKHFQQKTGKNTCLLIKFRPFCSADNNTMNITRRKF